MVQKQGKKKSKLLLASSALTNAKKNPLCIEMILLVEIQI
jgi:hypothetical protein